MKNLIQKLDLEEYIGKFQSFLAREKESIAMEGDRRRHFNFIKTLEDVDFKKPPEINNLDDVIFRIYKQSVLKLYEIYPFIQIVEYFSYLKTLDLKEPLKGWLSKIYIPEDIKEIVNFFTQDGDINNQNIPELFQIDNRIKKNKLEIRDSLQKIVHSSKMAPFIVDTQIRLYDGEEALLVRGGFLQVINADVIGRSESGFFYIVPRVVDNLKLREKRLKAERDEIIYTYRKQFSNIFHKRIHFLKFINREFDIFDNYQARVLFAKSYNYEFLLPKNGSRNVILNEFVHPAIEKPIPINISLTKPIMLITGVNAGGKTMLLKSILSAIFMSKYILPFRCNSSKTFIGEFKSIEAIIDDPQSISNDISTFAGRMLEFSKLFNKKNSIVGVDEVELGTDSDEASSLFRVLLDELKRRDITFIITTHHKRLASLMAGDKDVELIAALYDEENRLPTYTFLQGIIGKSYAFETAQRYGIPISVVEKAKKFFGEDKERLNELIEKSTTLEREIRVKKDKLDKKLKEIKKREEDLKKLKRDLEEKHKKALFDLEKSYKDMKSKVLEALKEVESARAKQLLNQAHLLKPRNYQDEDRNRVKSFNFKVGDRVKYRDNSATIISLKSNKAYISVENGLKISVPLRDLSPNSRAKPVKPTQNISNVTFQKPKKGSFSINLHGKRVDEALDEVDKFLSDALLNNFSEVEIIHGVGAGVLSRAVSNYLKKHPRVKNFSKMEGNIGVTVVSF